MITAKEGKRGPKDEGIHELVYLQKELDKLKILNLEFMVKECEEIFKVMDFDQDKYPELYFSLIGASKAEFDFQINIKKNMKKTKKTALGNQHIEDIFSVNSHKTRDGDYDSRIIGYFEKMIRMVQEEAINEYAPLMQEKWVNIARHRAGKGHISRDVDEAINMAKQYASMRNAQLDTPILEEMENLQKKSVEAYANKNMDMITSYASRVLKQRTSEERYKKLMHYAKKLSDESKSNIFHPKSALFPVSTEFPGIEK
jgi:hypothetical protein